MQTQPPILSDLPPSTSHDTSLTTSCAVLTRRHWLCTAAGAVAACSLSSVPSTWAAADAVLPLSTSLANELATALRRGQPLVVMVSLEGCVFCRAVRSGHLAPMRASNTISVVQVDMRSRLVTQDTQGTPTTHDDLIRAWGVKIAPTVLFFGRKGEEVAERLQGAYLPDFYGAYLDNRLAQAQARVRQQHSG